MPSASTSEYADFTSEQLQSVKRLDKIKDYYDLLGVSRDCSSEDLKRAYKRLALKLHPDKNQAPGASEAFKSINLAFSILSNPQERRRYEESQWEDVDEDRYHNHNNNNNNCNKNNNNRNNNHHFAYQQYESHCFDFFYSDKIFDDEFFESFFANQNFRTKYNRAKEKAKASRFNTQQKKQQQQQQPKKQQPQRQQKAQASSNNNNNNTCNKSKDNSNNNNTTSENQNRINKRKTNMNLLVQLSPLVFILILSLFNAFLSHQQPYTFAQNGKFVVKRHTSRLNIAFFTKESFKDGQLARVEQKIEEEQLQFLRTRCLQEKNDRDVQLWRARMRNDRELFMQAKDKIMPFCSKLQNLVVSY